MPETNLAPSFLPWLAALSGCFTAPSFETFLHLVSGWVSCLGRHVITNLICAADAVGIKHHSSFHRFFRQARWVPEHLGLCVLHLVLRLVPEKEPLLIALDDTLGRHTGKHISGAAMHHDPLLSTRTKVVHHWGHVWAVLAVVIRVPAWNKKFALPVLCRLYRSKQSCENTGRHFATKPALAREMLAVVARAVSPRHVCMIGDAGYINHEVCFSLPAHMHCIGRASMKAALYAPPQPRSSGRGRPRLKGERLPSPAQRAADPTGWQTLTVAVYGRTVQVQIKCFDALWYRVAGGRMMRFVLVRGWPGHRADDVLCTTDLTLDATAIIERYCLRWSIEVTFWETKGKLGFEEPQNRTDRAVERTAPMALWLYSLVVCWYLHRFGKESRPPLAQLPWYTKATPTFSDMLAELRLEIWQHQFASERAHASNRQNALLGCLYEFAYATSSDDIAPSIACLGYPPGK